jgi:hypothetical protein
MVTYLVLAFMAKAVNEEQNSSFRWSLKCSGGQSNTSDFGTGSQASLTWVLRSVLMSTCRILTEGLGLQNEKHINQFLIIKDKLSFIYSLE